MSGCSPHNLTKRGSVEFVRCCVPLIATIFPCNKVDRVRISHLEYLSSLQPFALRHYVPGWGSNPLPSTISVLRRNLYSVTFSCWHLQNLVVTVGLEPTINTVWRWCISHYATLPYRNTLAWTCRQLSLRGTNMFLYGRGTGNRTLIDWLKASYSSRWIIPPYGPQRQIRTDTSSVKSRVRYR